MKTLKIFTLLITLTLLSACNLFKRQRTEPIAVLPNNKTTVSADSSTEPSGLLPSNPFSYYVFKVTTVAGTERLKVQLNSSENGLSYRYSFGYKKFNGTVSMTKDAMISSESIKTNFNQKGDTLNLSKSSMLFFSKNAILELKNSGKTTVSLNDREVLNLVIEESGLKTEFTVLVDNIKKTIPVIVAKSSNPANTKRFMILDDPNFPIILSMNVDFTLELESAHGVGNIPPLFELKPGLIMHYEVSEHGINSQDLYIKVIEISDSGAIMNCKTYDDDMNVIKDVKMVFNRQSILNPSGFISPEPRDFESKVKYIYNGSFLTTMRGGFDVALVAGKSIIPFEHFVVEPEMFEDSAERAQAEIEEQRSNYTEYTLGSEDYDGLNRELFLMYLEDTQLDLYPISLKSDRYKHDLQVYPCTQFPMILHFKNGNLGLEMTLLDVGTTEPKKID